MGFIVYYIFYYYFVNCVQHIIHISTIYNKPMNVYAYTHFLLESLILSSYQYTTEAYLLYLLAYKFLTNHLQETTQRLCASVSHP